MPSMNARLVRLALLDMVVGYVNVGMLCASGRDITKAEPNSRMPDRERERAHSAGHTGHGLGGAHHHPIRLYAHLFCVAWMRIHCGGTHLEK